MDYNYNNDQKQMERTNVNPWDILSRGGMLSKPIIREDTVDMPEAPTYNADNAPQYIDYIETGKMPTWMKDGSPEAIAFKKAAWDGYISAKSEALSTKGFSIVNKNAYMNIDPDTRKAVNKSIAQIPQFEKAMSELIELVEKHGIEIPTTTAWRRISQKAKNAQLIAKEIYNLWVLNWPDLALMEQVIPDPTSLSANTIGRASFTRYLKLIEEWRDTILNNSYSQAQSIGLDTAKYEEWKDYSAWAVFTKDGKKRRVWSDGNAYEM